MTPNPTAVKRRQRAARLRSEQEALILETARDNLTDSGLLDLVRFGEIRIVVANWQIDQILVQSSFKPRVVTTELPTA